MSTYKIIRLFRSMCIIESMSDDGMVWRGLGKGGEVVGMWDV